MVWLALCAIATAALVLAERKNSKLGRVIAKLAASASFVAYGATLLGTKGTFNLALLGGLVCAALGDALLLAADHERQGERFFLVGLVAFLLAHLAYAAAFLVRGVSIFAIEGTALPLVIALGVVLAWLLPRVPSPMRAPVVVYAVAISAMVSLAVATVALHGGALIAVGAVAFYLSDLSVARDRFVAPGFVNRAWGLPLYYAAQLAIASGAGG
jgi:uncharacterized membrane protein YhhN